MLYVAPPDAASRAAILRIHLRKMPHPQEVEEAVDDLARRTERYSGAEMAAVCREACLFALRENLEATEVALRHFLLAIDAVVPRTTQEVLDFYDQFRQSCGIESI